MGKRFTKKSILQLNKFFSKYGIDCTCEFGDELKYEPSDLCIVIEKKYDSSIDEFFVSYLTNLGLEKKVDAIVLSILHELGHHYTCNQFTEFEWRIDNLRKDTQIYLGDKKDPSNEEILFGYWDCPTERCAQEWVVNTCRECPEFVEELERILLPTMRKEI